MDEAIPWLCCMCWLLPLGVLGVVVTITSGIAQAWRTRGLEQGVIYCGRCRFDLRGAMSDRCSECGATLAGRNLLVTGMPPPASLAVRTVFFLLAGIAPTIFALILLGAVMPFNYSAYRDMELSVIIRVEAQQDTRFSGQEWLEVPIKLSTGRATAGLFSSEADLVHMWIGKPRDRYLQGVESDQFNPTDLDWTNTDEVEKEWNRVVAFNPEITGDADPDDVRDEFVELVQAIGSGAEPMHTVRGNYFDVSADEYRVPQTHPGYVLFSIVAALAVVVGLVVLAVRQQAKADAEFRQRLGQLQHRFDQMVEANRKALGRGVAPGHNA